MINVFKLQIQLIFMILSPSIKLSSTIGEHPENWYFILIKEWNYSVIQDIRRSDGMLAGVQFCKGDTAVGINDGLLINTAYAFNCSDVIGVLGNQISRMFRFNFAVRFLLFLFTFKSDYLSIR